MLEGTPLPLELDGGPKITARPDSFAPPARA